MQDSHATHSDSQVEIAWGTDLPSTYLTHYTLGMMIMREKAVGMDHHKEELEVKETSLVYRIKALRGVQLGPIF